MVQVNNFTDAFVSQKSPNKNTGNGKRLRVSTQSGDNFYSYLYFTKPWPPGATITSAKLKLRVIDAVTSSTSLTVQRVTSKWSVNRITWNNQPGVGGATASVTKTSAGAGAVWEIDVTALLQTVANGGVWYGFRLTTNRGIEIPLYSTQASGTAYRPSLEVTWSTAPDEPTNLSPGGGRVISLASPTLNYNFVDDSGNTSQMGHQIQIASSSALLTAGTPDWDSGLAFTGESELDLNKGAMRLFSGGTTSGSTTVTGPAGYVASVDVGMAIEGANLPAGTVVSSITNTTTFVVSKAATATGTGLLAIYRKWRAIANNETVWWRVRTQDGTGLWSPWSDPASFTRKTQGVLTITKPTTGIFEGSPVVTWTFTGRTQRSYMVWLTKKDDPVFVWSSGKITSANTSANIPFGQIDNIDEEYSVFVFVWDTENRESIPGDTNYVLARKDDLYVTFGSSPVAPQNLTSSSDPLFPSATLKWDWAGAAPDYFQILRSINDGPFMYLDEELPSAIPNGANKYKYEDNTAPNYTPLKWRVVAVTGGVQGAVAEVPGNVRRIAPVMMRPNKSDPMFFLNAEIDRSFMDIQEVAQTRDGNAVLTTQALGRQRGVVRGVFASEVVPGLTAKIMLNRFLKVRKQPGTAMILSILDESLKVACFNMRYNSESKTEGVIYRVEFEWIQIS